MAARAMQLVFLFYMLVSFTVCNEVFKLVKSSVQLDIQKENYSVTFFTWSVNRQIIVQYNGATPSTILRNQDRVKFDEKTHSLTLKNLQRSDSGSYEAVVINTESKSVATYQLHVLDPVEKPVLNVSVQQSNHTCNVTLTCEAQELSVNSSCYNDFCDVMEKKITVGQILSFSYVNNSFIICNYSNPVSWKTATMEKEKLCPSNGVTLLPMVTGSYQAVTIIVGILAIILIIGVFIFGLKKCNSTTDSVNTVYEEVDLSKKGDKKRESRKMSENPETPGTVYYTVGRPAQPCSYDESTVSTANPGNENQGAEIHCDTVEFQTPQTIYATVNKAGINLCKKPS